MINDVIADWFCCLMMPSSGRYPYQLQGVGPDNDDVTYMLTSGGGWVGVGASGGRGGCCGATCRCVDGALTRGSKAQHHRGQAMMPFCLHAVPSLPHPAANTVKQIACPPVQS